MAQETNVAKIMISQSLLNGIATSFWGGCVNFLVYCSSADDDDVCLLPGCTNPKFMDTSSGVVHDFCCKSHAKEYIRAYGRRKL